MSVLGADQLFERYRIIQYLGSGVSGESYEAEDTILLRKATLKLIHPWTTLSDSARRQFFREMQGISLLSHPYLAAVLDYGEVDGRLYVARRYVSSGSLLSGNGRSWFHAPLSSAVAIYYSHQLAQALQYIHEHGYLHGALTFSNILILRGPNVENEPGYAPFLLSDVGLANFVRRFGAPQISLLPVSAAPEQLGRRVTPESDQFALATLLYFWLTGRPPYLGTPDEVEQMKLTEAIAPLSSFNPTITVEQNGIILRALSVYPEDRYPSVLAFADALLATLTPKTKPIPADMPATRLEFIAAVETPSVENLGIKLHADSETLSVIEARPSVFNASQPIQPQTTAQEPPAPEASQSLPEPLPQITPDVPQPLPEPNVPQPQPDPVPQPLPDAPQKPVEPDLPSPTPNPVPQPLPDVPQPLPEPSTPPPHHGTLPQAESIVIAKAPIPREPEAMPTPPPATPPQINTTFVEQAPTPPETPVQMEPALESILAKIKEQSTPTQLPVDPPALKDEQEQQPISPRVIITSPYTEEPHEFLLEHDETNIGRAGSSDLLLERDNMTSRHHALLRRIGNRYLLYDRRSANGVYVNGQRLAIDTGYELTDGDHITIGSYELIFRFVPDPNISHLSPVSQLI